MSGVTIRHTHECLSADKIRIRASQLWLRHPRRRRTLGAGASESQAARIEPSILARDSGSCSRCTNATTTSLHTGQSKGVAESCAAGMGVAGREKRAQA